MRKLSGLTVLAALVMTVVSCTARPTGKIPARETVSDPESRLLILKSQKVVLGILPEAGAHVVLFRSTGGSNVLDSDPSTWSEPAPGFTVLEPKFPQYGGHVVWLGPQKEWWTQQDINVDRKSRRVPWPPDPFLTLGKYEVSERDEDSVKLVSPPSPVTGIQLTKEISVRRDKARLKITATNIRNTPVSWDIWSNTRVCKDAFVYVPVDPEGKPFKLESGGMHPERDYVLPYRVESDFLHFDVEAARGEGKHNYSAKVYMNPPEGVIAAFCGDFLFMKKSAIVPSEKIHPDHAFVEIFRKIGMNPNDSLAETEMHGEYMTLKPGEGMTFEETWELIPCGSLPDDAARIKFLKEL